MCGVRSLRKHPPWRPGPSSGEAVRGAALLLIPEMAQGLPLSWHGLLSGTRSPHFPKPLDLGLIPFKGKIPHRKLAVKLYPPLNRSVDECVNASPERVDFSRQSR